MAQFTVAWHRAARRPRPGEESAAGANSGGRVAELDALRALAAMAVLIFHANSAWLPFGWAAVDLFFVLSGYLITSIILRDGGGPGFLRNFYVRRGLRTWPIYYLVIAALIVLSPMLARPMLWSGLPYALTYTQGLPRLWSGTGGRFSVYLGHTWTLAVEEQFYLLWPALVLLVGRRRLPVLALACAGASVLSRGRGILLESLLSRADGLALGGWLASYRMGRYGSATSRLTLGPALAALVVLIAMQARGGLGPAGWPRSHPGSVILAFNLLWVGLIDLVLTHAGRPGLRRLRLRPLRYLGEISYGLYLYHLPILLIAIDCAKGLGLSGKMYGVRLLALVASVAVAGLSWRFIERPLLGLKRRFPYSRGTDGTRRFGTAPIGRFRSGDGVSPYRTPDRVEERASQGIARGPA